MNITVLRVAVPSIVVDTLLTAALTFSIFIVDIKYILS